MTHDKLRPGQKGLDTKKIEVGGREFWKSESQAKGSAGKMRNITFTTAIDGYVLRFNIVSFDPNLTDQLQHSLENITFFDPATAKEIAGPDSRPYRPASASHQ
jgi:hypothetical protein